MDKIIALDIDGVLADFNRAGLAKFGPCDESLYSLKERWPHQEPEIDAWANSPLVYRHLQTVPGAWRGAWKLHQAGYNLLAVTARAPTDLMHHVTAAWLIENAFPIYDLEVVDWRQKADCVYQHCPIAVIDDSPNQVQEMRDCGMNVFVFDQPWNRESEGPRMMGWGADHELLAALLDLA